MVLYHMVINNYLKKLVAIISIHNTSKKYQKRVKYKGSNKTLDFHWHDDK